MTARRFPSGKRVGLPPRAPTDRFLELVSIDADTGCWPWLGGLTQDGYARFFGRRAPGCSILAHRFAYKRFVGPIPEGMTVDHTCHNRDAFCNGGTTCEHRRCVNPWHLEAVTHDEDCRRGRHFLRERTHCFSGHAFSEVNTYWYGTKRACRTCRRDRERARRLARKVAA